MVLQVFVLWLSRLFFLLGHESIHLFVSRKNGDHGMFVAVIVVVHAAAVALRLLLYCCLFSSFVVAGFIVGFPFAFLSLSSAF